MAPQPTPARETTCKCCGARAQWFGSCDFSKNCHEHLGTVLPPSGISVHYYRCVECHFLFTTYFDNATYDDLKRIIYNDGYVCVDPDCLENRPTNNAGFVAECFSDHRTDVSILDYGGGNGVLAERLRALGFADVETYDPFYEEFAARPQRTFNIVLSFEVVEHVTKPVETMQDMARYLDADCGLLMFTTMLSPADPDAYGMDWWYIAPRNGHCSIHSSKSLNMVLRQCGLTLTTATTNIALHCAYREIPHFAEDFHRRMKIPG